MTTIPTTERLAKALIDANAPDSMITKARLGYYDDYKTSIPAPQLQLMADAKLYGLTNIYRRARNGEFESTKEESNEWFYKEGRKLLQDET